MKKVIAIIVSILLIGGIACVIVFGVKDCNNKKTTDENNTVSTEYLMKNKYTVGDTIISGFYTYSDIEFVGITYRIDAGTETVVTGFKTGESAEHERYNGEGGKYYIDTAAQIIDSSSLSVGWHHIVYYGTAKDGGVHELCQPFLFKIVAVQTAE